MLEFRLLSTKCLSVEQQNRLIQTGVSYSCWDFIKSTPTNFKANPENKSLIFSSQNAVKSVFNQFRFRGNNCYCVGGKTQKLLEENGQKVVFECNETAQKRDYSGELETDWEGKPRMECLEHKVAESTVRFIKVGAMAKFGI